MNQIQEMDWAEECWHGHTGMDSTNDYCVVDDGDKKKQQPEPEAEQQETDRK